MTPLIIPPAALILMDLFPKAVPPVANIKGIKPATKAKDVINIGRKRMRAAAIPAS